MVIRSVMTPHVVTCHASDTLERAAQLMWENDLGLVAVVDREDRLIGVITDRDALMAAYTRGSTLSGLLVECAMSKRPITCQIHDDAIEVEHLMASHQVRRVPVVDREGKPTGIVTLADLARASLCGHELSPRGPTSTLAAITQPRRATGS